MKPRFTTAVAQTTDILFTSVRMLALLEGFDLSFYLFAIYDVCSSFTNGTGAENMHVFFRQLGRVVFEISFNFH